MALCRTGLLCLETSKATSNTACSALGCLMHMLHPHPGKNKAQWPKFDFLITMALYHDDV